MNHHSQELAELSLEEKRALLADMVRKRAQPAEICFPLSQGQQALWFLHQLAPDNAAYNIASAWKIYATLEAPALQQALQTLVARHASLRTTYTLRDGQPVQQVHSKQAVQFQAIDVSQWSESELNRQLNAAAHAPFDIQQELPIRVRLFSRSSRDHILLFIIHHLASDLWSCVVLVNELYLMLTAARAGQSVKLPPLRAQYKNYVDWQRELLGGPEGDRLWQYWQRQLADLPPRLELPMARPRPRLQTHHGALYRFEVDEPLSAGLRKLAKVEGTTLYVVLLTAFQALLYRYTGQTDILVGSLTSGRTRPEFSEVVGYFANPAVLRACVSSLDTFHTLLHRARATVVEAVAHQDYPFSLLVQKLNVKRDLSRSPLFDVLFILQKVQRFRLEQQALSRREPGPGEADGPPPSPAGLQLEDAWLEPYLLEQRAIRFDLEVELYDVGSWLGGAITYNADLFEAESIARMVGHYQTLLAAVVADPERPLAQLPLLTPAERRQLLVDGNATSAPWPWLTLPQGFEAQAERTPHALALQFGDEGLTYQQLHQRANQLAHYLQALGAGPETRVAVWLERGLNLIVSLLAVLKAGAAYVPLDPAYPPARVAYMLHDAQACLLLTQASLVECLPPTKARVVCLDTEWPAHCPTAGLASPIAPDQLAYVLYTSGSTGQPKGVMVSHRNVANVLQAFQARLALTPADCCLSLTSISFDIAALELFWPLTVGARVVVASRELALDGRQLQAELQRVGASLLQATPSGWQLLVAGGWSGQPGLRLLCGGERLPEGLAQALRERGAEVWNLYGPTETTIWSTLTQVENTAAAIPLGRPIANTDVYVLDEAGELAPLGVAGELYIGGAGVARGYHQRPDLTAERFVPDGWSGRVGARLYRTGDWVRYGPEGRLEFKGRRDEQVKLRGHRIELGEVEAHLRQHAAIREAVVQLWRPGSEAQLVAYVVPLPAAQVSLEALRSFLRERLPDYMLPGALVVVEAMPLTPNGKIDRRALRLTVRHPDGEANGEGEPAAGRGLPVTGVVLPQTGLERQVAAIWQEVLGLAQVGRHDNFFDLGGHSLLLVQVHLKLREQLQQEFSIIELFNYPTVSALANYLTQEKATELALRDTDDQAQKLKQGRERLRRRFAQRQQF